MDLQKNWEEILAFSLKDEKNRLLTIKSASKLILALTENKGKPLSKEELKKLSGGVASPDLTLF